MLFNSLTFIVFFLIVLMVHYSPITWKGKKISLLVASYVFYAAWNPPFVLLLWLSTFVDWHAAKRMYASDDPAVRKRWLLLSLFINLGMLGFFKYGGFLLENFVSLVQMAGFDFAPAAPDIILPMGISFYTFQTMAYTIDVYLKRDKPAGSFLDFSLFVTFFPQLVAGPIVRPSELIPQFQVPRVATSSQLIWGFGLMTLGLFQKLVIADTLFSPVSEDVFGNFAPVHIGDAWLGLLAFSGQIFCDFAGYSTTAIGAALCLGFALPDNFNMPYAAIGFSDFWRRWHISLSSWLRDYLYIPLGGNRGSKGRTYYNLMMTMFLGGLWHGASWTFAIWGVLHGLYLVVERFLKKIFGGRSWLNNMSVKFGLGLLTFYFVNIAWVFFRAENFEKAGMMMASLHGFIPDGMKILSTLSILSVVGGMGGMLLVHWWMRERTLESIVAKMSWWQVGIIWSAMLFLLIINQGGGNAFIYFQF